jgi:hypothetical protein
MLYYDAHLDIYDDDIDSLADSLCSIDDEFDIDETIDLNITPNDDNQTLHTSNNQTNLNGVSAHSSDSRSSAAKERYRNMKRRSQQYWDNLKDELKDSLCSYINHFPPMQCTFGKDCDSSDLYKCRTCSSSHFYCRECLQISHTNFLPHNIER